LLKVDEVIHLDLEYPERNNDLFVHRINEVHDASGTELVDQIKVILPHMAKDGISEIIASDQLYNKTTKKQT
jgi:hypothetical protein